jgi:hypothetical protein
MANQQPTCYGKLWDPNAVECRGGLDPSYSHPKMGNRREMCKWYQACSAASTHSKLQQAAKVAPPPPPPQVAPPQVVPATAIVRPPPPAGMPQVMAPQQVQSAVQVPQAQAVVHGPPPQQQIAHAAGVAYTQPQYAAMPTMVPMNQPMMGSNIPSVLVVPEPPDPSVPLGLRMWREVTRAVGFAACLTAANFITYNPVGRPRGQ